MRVDTCAKPVFIEPDMRSYNINPELMINISVLKQNIIGTDALRKRNYEHIAFVLRDILIYQ